MEGKPNQLYTQGMRSFEQYDEICKYFAEGKQRDNDANNNSKAFATLRFKFRGIFS